MKIKSLYLLSAFSAFTLILAALYLQFTSGLNPCPLCLLQRFAFGILGLFFMLGFLLYNNKLISLLINIACIVSSSIGILFAGRQVWLQYFPNIQAVGCSASLSYMINILPFNELIKRLFEGTAECSEKGWSFLTLGLAEWALLWFILFLAISFYLLVRLSLKNQRSK